MIREKEELLSEIQGNSRLRLMYEQWSQDEKENFVNFCCGNRGIRILYDSFFKEVMNAESDRTRLEDFLGTILNRKVKIVNILQNDSTRIADETSLLVTDIVVELEDGTLANVEIQKVGYMFPGARCACYSADLLLRQYKRVREQKKKKFSYRDVKTVFLIVLYEHSPQEFHDYPDIYCHHAKQVFDSRLKLDLLQEFYMLPLDIFKKHMQNRNIENKLEAWLTFFSEDRPEKIVELINLYPQFKAMYQTLYNMCQNTEQLMGIFSKELRELDRNTAEYMIEEQQRVIEQNRQTIAQNRQTIEQHRQTIEQNRQTIEQNRQTIEQHRQTIEQHRQTIAQNQKTIEQNQQTIEQDRQTIEQNRQTIARQQETIAQNMQTISEKDEIIAALMKALEEQKKTV
ncbi:MAG: PD-(D/E)XK nuclease family transposase [Lachnospiraceae bacterium]|nr:PD-(D/E)XK nuclease family transposase [Lachnospiraceae bacterium]